jgi:hypothetical protein
LDSRIGSGAAVLLLAFVIDVFAVISTKQELDHCVDQMVKQIQLSGAGVSEHYWK